MGDSPQDVAQPPLSPTLKRKRGDSIASANGNGQVIIEDILDAATDDDGDISEIDEDMLEDIADQMAMSSEGHELSLALSPAEVRQKIQTVGHRAFLNEVLERSKLRPKVLGMSFGLDPENIDDDELYMFLLERVVARALTRRRKLPQYNTISDAADLLRKSKHIMIITGAGISTSLGIPDFRSKHTGFYSKLQDMGYNEPEEVFDIEIFDETPNIFYSLAGDILPAGKDYTPTHGFIKLVQDQGTLQTNYTQNIDNLEANAGIDPAKLIQCHGSFATASCRKCKHKVPGEEIFDDIRAKRVAQCKQCLKALSVPDKRPIKRQRSKSAFDDSEDDDIPMAGIMKPDITFFGEQLPDNFFDRFTEQDCDVTDLVIVIGTSLKVAPVAEIPNHLPEHVPHIYISREPCKHINFDIQLLGNCDEVVWELSRRAGWKLEHGMIPEGLRLQVNQDDISDHCWRVEQLDTSEA